jgi:hypothetical protein
MYLTEVARLILANGIFTRTSSKYEAKIANPKILSLIGAKKREKTGSKTNPDEPEPGQESQA